MQMFLTATGVNSDYFRKIPICKTSSTASPSKTSIRSKRIKLWFGSVSHPLIFSLLMKLFCSPMLSEWLSYCLRASLTVSEHFRTTAQSGKMQVLCGKKSSPHRVNVVYAATDFRCGTFSFTYLWGGGQEVQPGFPASAWQSCIENSGMAIQTL